MDAAQIVKLALAASLMLVVFGLGLRATFADATFLLRTMFHAPHRLLRAIAAMYVVVPVVAVAIALAFDLPRPVKLALVAMAVSPVPPILPGKLLKFGGDEGPTFGLLFTISLLSIVLVPLAVELLGWIFRTDVHIGPDVIARIVATSILAPLIVGMLLRRFAPGLAATLAPWAQKIGTVLLLLGVIAVLVAVFPAMRALVGDGTLVAFTAVALVAIAAGHLLGGPGHDDRTVLGISAAMRHPGVAIAVAHAAYPDEKLAPAAVLMFLLVGVVLTSIYGKLRMRKHPA